MYGSANTTFPAKFTTSSIDQWNLAAIHGFYNYHLETLIAVAASLESNGEIGQMTKAWPDRFADLATLLMQDSVCAWTFLFPEHHLSRLRELYTLGSRE